MCVPESLLPNHTANLIRHILQRLSFSLCFFMTFSSCCVKNCKMSTHDLSLIACIHSKIQQRLIHTINIETVNIVLYETKCNNSYGKQKYFLGLKSNCGLPEVLQEIPAVYYIWFLLLFQFHFNFGARLYHLIDSTFCQFSLNPEANCFQFTDILFALCWPADSVGCFNYVTYS